jgi:hypothetical protein
MQILENDVKFTIIFAYDNVDKIMNVDVDSESIVRFIEDQPFSPSYDLAPPPTPSPLLSHR